MGVFEDDGEVIIERVAVPQREERASPRNPRVETSARSEKEVSFEVWCFRAARFSLLVFVRSFESRREREKGKRTDPSPITLFNPLPVVLNFKRLESMFSKSDFCASSLSHQLRLPSVEKRE